MRDCSLSPPPSRCDISRFVAFKSKPKSTSAGDSLLFPAPCPLDPAPRKSAHHRPAPNEACLPVSNGERHPLLAHLRLAHTLFALLGPQIVTSAVTG